MKQIGRATAGVLVFLAMAFPVSAAETIKRFDVEATLAADRALILTERITYDFGAAERHGIYRVIPIVSDRNGLRYRLRLKALGARMDGEKTPFRVMDVAVGMEVRVGDPDRTVQGVHTFEIFYRTDRAINFFDDHSELYWNVTGNDWKTPIETSSFRLNAPAGANRTACYTGPYGSTESSCQVDVRGNMVDGVSRPLGPMEGFTIVVGFPLGAIRDLTRTERAWQVATDNPFLTMPILVFFLMFAIWWKFGKEPKGRGTIIAQYEPPAGMTPALMAALDEQWMADRAVSGTILDLARRGYLRIHFTETGKNFRFVKLKNEDETFLSYEKTLFNGLFATASDAPMDALKQTYWQSVVKARKQVFEELRGRGLFGKNPSVVRGIWMAIAVAPIFFAFFLTDGGGSYLTALVSSIIIALFGYQMPRMTKKGAVMREEVKGFEKFLSVTEKTRLDFTDAPERTPKQFHAFLPAAVAFGVEEKWAGQFVA